MSALVPDGREKVLPVVEDGPRLQLVHQGWEDSALELLPEVLAGSLPKVRACSDAVPVDHHDTDILYQVHGYLSLQDTPEKQLMLLSSPLDSGELLRSDDWHVFGDRRGLECKLDQPREVNEGNLVWDILGTKFNIISPVLRINCYVKVDFVFVI